MTTPSGMRATLVRFRVTGIIVHDIPKRFGGDASGGPKLSEVESELGEDLRQFFTDRVRDSLRTAAVDAVFQDEHHVMPSLILNQLSGEPSDFVEMSQAVARHLHASQSGRNSPGILVVLKGSIGSATPCVGVLKLERQSGVRLEPIVSEGRQTFDILAVQDLMLTEKTRVFKAALFVQDGQGFGDIQALVSDLQRGVSSDVADFFLSHFLGCKRREDPEVTTKHFYDVASQWIDQNVGDPETKVRYQIGLISEMNSNSTSINPYAFVGDQMQGDDRGLLRAHLIASGISETFVPKDTKLIDRQIARVTLEHRDGIKVIGSAEAIRDRVTITTSDEGEPQTVIRDEVEHVRNR